MHTSLLISADLNRAIMLRSHHNRSTLRPKPIKSLSDKLAIIALSSLSTPILSPHSAVKRSEAQYESKSYADGLQRAFNKAKEQIYFNSDMSNFVTLTYHRADQTLEEVLQHVKIFVKAQNRANANSLPAGSGIKKLKYIYVMEYQKRGSIHVHMITNDALTTYKNKNGYPSLTYWKHGYSSVLTIKDFDSNFRPYLYLFKYMKKSQRIGKSFVHSSRNLTNYTKLKDSTINLQQWRTVAQELTQAHIRDNHFYFYKNYLQFDDTLATSLNKKDTIQCLEQVQSHSSKELEKLLKNHILH